MRPRPPSVISYLLCKLRPSAYRYPHRIHLPTSLIQILAYLNEYNVLAVSNKGDEACGRESRAHAHSQSSGLNLQHPVLYALFDVLHPRLDLVAIVGPYRVLQGGLQQLLHVCAKELCIKGGSGRVGGRCL